MLIALTVGDEEPGTLARGCCESNAPDGVEIRPRVRGCVETRKRGHEGFPFGIPHEVALRQPEITGREMTGQVIEPVVIGHPCPPMRRWWRLLIADFALLKWRP